MRVTGRESQAPRVGAPLRLQSAAGAKVTFGLVIFASAFLLFQVEPLIAKILLPWFGGAAEVWIVCLLFFQVVLLFGYYYAHFLARRLPPRTQGRVHAALLAASLLALPILPRSAWKSSASGDPVFHILLLLAITVGRASCLRHAPSRRSDLPRP